MRTKSIVITKAQIVFVNAILQGMTQRQAFLKAYPMRRKWKDSAIDSAASTLFKQEKVRKRYDELLQELQKSEQEKTGWTREQSIRTLRKVIDANLSEVDRIQIAAEEELENILTQIKVEPEKATQYIALVLKKRQMRRLSGVHNTGIVTAVAELNKMQGFNEETINLNGAVIFSGEDELED